jgi:rhodanese-related sulfurtransferase
MGLFARTPQTDAAALAERLGSRSVLVLDVRTAAEWKRGHIRGAENVPLGSVKNRAAKLPRDRTIVTVCASGHRSAAAARALRKAGFEVENLKGGMSGWARQGLPVEKKRR